MTGEGPDIFKDGHLDIAHPIARKWQSYRLSGEEWQLLWVIMEKTWAWHKPWENIPLKQFSEETGMKKSHVIRIIQKLIDKKIVTQKGNGKLKSYHINSHFEQWKLFPKKVTIKIVPQKGNDSFPKMVTTVPQKGNENSSNPTSGAESQAPKESIKESIKEIKDSGKPPNEPYQLFQYFYEKMAIRDKESVPETMINKERELRNAKFLLKKMNLEECKEFIDKVLSHNSFYCTHTNTLSYLYSNLTNLYKEIRQKGSNDGRHVFISKSTEENRGLKEGEVRIIHPGES